MENLFCVREEESFITLSGVEITIRELIGEHQVLISKQDAGQRSKGFRKLLKDCIIKIGVKSESEITESDIDMLLEGDRRQILWKLRQLSNPDNKEFVFDYEFPAKGGKKLKQRCNISIDKENFPLNPYRWVREKMIADYCSANGIELESISDSDKQLALSHEITSMYATYQEMLDSNRYQKLTLTRSKQEVTYELVTTEIAEKMAKVITAESVTSHTQLQMHRPRYKTTNSKGIETFIQLDLDRLVLSDIECLRKHIMDTEGSIDTTVVVQYESNSSLQNQIDLVSLAAFFFPSLAI
jgi:hypothetical protein